MRQKRRTPRRRPSERIEVYDINSGQVIGYLVNLTGEGFMLLGSLPIAPSTLFQLRLPLSPVTHESVDFGAECLWCRRSGKANHYWSGFQIIDVSPEHSAQIQELTKDWKASK